MRGESTHLLRLLEQGGRRVAEHRPGAVAFTSAGLLLGAASVISSAAVALIPLLLLAAFATERRTRARDVTSDAAVGWLVETWVEDASFIPVCARR